MKKIFLCTQSLYRSETPTCRWTTIDDNGWVEGETPVEDFGMFLILHEEITPESASRLFLALLADHAPTIVEDPSKEKWHMSIFYLTPAEYKIFEELVDK